jgi:hypothetical protein
MSTEPLVTMPSQDEQDAASPFHRHLEMCAQCANNPMNLCRTGQMLLKEAAEAASPSMNWSHKS